MKSLVLLAMAMLIGQFNVLAQTNRTFDGTGNNLSNPTWGSNGANLEYHIGTAYADGISTPSGADRPNPREVSNVIFDQPSFVESNLEISDFGWGFGQFIDHDITFVDDNQSELIPIPVPSCDAHFDPGCSGLSTISMKRSVSDPLTGSDIGNPRKVFNGITSFVDGSAVYGSDEARASWLRTFDGGKLKTSSGNLLPFNTTNGESDGPIDPTAPFMLIEGIPPASHFVAGDIRANEQPGLSSFHTLFMREHNRLCDELASEFPAWTDEELYQRARKMVGANIQAVLYEEFLPALGLEIPAYTSYSEVVNPTIMNVFSAAAYRLGHTLVNDQIIRMTDEGDSLIFGSIQIKQAFFNPSVIVDEGGIDPILIGMATQMQQKFDTEVVPTLRNFLFGPPGSGGLDLVSLNLNRGRERGLPDYNSIREQMGLEKYTMWSQITPDTELQNKIETAYGSIDNVDPWVGMLSEEMMTDKAIGELVYFILMEQFIRLRDGDRYYYENDPELSEAEKQEIKETKLSEIIKRNTGITNIQDDVFHAQEHVLTTVEIHPFKNLKTIDINAYPNPVNQHMNLAFNAREPGSYRLTLSNISGQIFMEELLEVSTGENSFRFDLDAAYTNGIYLINIKSETGNGSLQLVKQ